MSVKNGLERTAKWFSVPLVFLLAAVPGAWADVESGGPRVLTVVPTELLAKDQAWDQLMRWLIEQLMLKTHCDPSGVPDEVPVAMLVLSDCYLSGGLASMSADEKTEYLATIDETMLAMQSSPSSVPLLTRVQFMSTLKLMRAEVQLLP